MRVASLRLLTQRHPHCPDRMEISTIGTMFPATLHFRIWLRSEVHVGYLTRVREISGAAPLSLVARFSWLQTKDVMPTARAQAAVVGPAASQAWAVIGRGLGVAAALPACGSCSCICR